MQAFRYEYIEPSGVYHTGRATRAKVSYSADEIVVRTYDDDDNPIVEILMSNKVGDGEQRTVARSFRCPYFRCQAED